MAIDIGGIFSGVGGSNIIGLVTSLVIFGFIVIVVFGGLAYSYYKKKRWYLLVEVKIPRSDGRLINAEWAKGMYDPRRGVVFVKRKGIKKSALKPFDVKKYIQGTNVITVVQTGINEYVPVIQDSYINMIDDITGEEAALMKVKVDLTESKAWRSQFEREAKAAYSIDSILKQFLPFIGWGLVLFLNFLGFAILYTRIS